MGVIDQHSREVAPDFRQPGFRKLFAPEEHGELGFRISNFEFRRDDERLFYEYSGVGEDSFGDVGGVDAVDERAVESEKDAAANHSP